MRVLRAIVARGLPEPVQQHELQLPGRRCRLDLAYPDYKVAIEVDGWAHHGPRSAFESDRARGNDIAIAKWLPLHFTADSTDRQIGIKTEAALRSQGWQPLRSPQLGR
jgi:very-short-patch-repair endonuclease